MVWLVESKDTPRGCSLHEAAFAIVMPPPNVTGSFHVGHMLNNTVQDVIVRRKRMQVQHALASEWIMPVSPRSGWWSGNCAARALACDLGREKFVERV
jgi:valyl-tRNA synthetase